jgi:hypothetical protein
MQFRLFVSLTAAFATAAIVVQGSTPANAAPVAYAFVSTASPNNVETLAVSSSGSFTHVGTASSPTTIYHMSTNGKFVFGIDDASNIYTYSIGPTGALTLVATTNAGEYVSGFSSAYSIPLTQVDPQGATIYTMVGTSQTDWFLESFKIESNGMLQFLGKTYADPNALNQIRFVQNGVYAFTDGCYNTAPGASFTTDSNDISDLVVYERGSTGLLSYLATSNDPPTSEGGEDYCAGANANDPTDHVAVAFTTFYPAGDDIVGGTSLGTYTVQGTPTTTSNYDNMPITSVTASAMSIDPTGKLLAVVGAGAFDVFHFNGANPITKYTGEIKTSGANRFVAWDKSSHMYMLTDHSVDIYNATPTTFTELKPWEFTAPYGMIVLSLQ